jgi:RNA polymerase sigma-70 factor (ECF subfamily)
MEAAISITDGAFAPKSKGWGARRDAAVSPKPGACQSRRPIFETSVAAPETPESGADIAPTGDAAFHAHLMERVARGDHVAFAELFAHYAPRIKGYLLRLGLEAAQAEELSQEVMIAVWRKAASFDPQQAGVTTWIFRIARNRRIDAFRREHRGAFDPDDPVLQPEPEVAPDATMDMAAREAEVRAALAELSEDQRLLVREAFYEDLSHSQIASKTGLPLGTVKSRLRLAFTKLKLSLALNASERERS